MKITLPIVLKTNENIVVDVRISLRLSLSLSFSLFPLSLIVSISGRVGTTDMHHHPRLQTFLIILAFYKFYIKCGSFCVLSSLMLI
jgi:hypothetical protein